MLDEADWPATGQASSLAAARIWALVVSVGMKVNGNDEVWEVPEGTRYRRVCICLFETQSVLKGFQALLVARYVVLLVVARYMVLLVATRYVVLLVAARQRSSTDHGE